jgi:hypothetical protein
LRFSENNAIVRLVMMTSSIDGASVGRHRPQVSAVGRRGSGRWKKKMTRVGDKLLKRLDSEKGIKAFFLVFFGLG